ncbi:jupiter microtubule associated homolog 2 isoform X1 [Stegastes partitus]|uniref:Jupiter microtubule associated homolog 2 isoform X1 n=1 Tax=Stegastes partitus TaxID=144197 RepID=A0A9Y4NU52_9TELE|nr:PREDICTED: hematological and neurological expressed 1-like protein isoform X1 [Stegastes partitus]
MTSTNMFQGLESGAKPSSRVLQPPGGGSSNLFGGYEDDSAATRRPNKMASKVFAPPEEPQSVPKRSNPPGQTKPPGLMDVQRQSSQSIMSQGGKSSGIFGEPEAPAQPQRPVPPGGPTSNIFGAAESAPVQSPSRSHPNKPKDNLSVGAEPESPAPEPKVSLPEVKEEPAPPAPAPVKEEPAPVSAPPAPEPTSTSTPTTTTTTETADDGSLKNHEPHLGPRPRSHNRVLNPPGGKSSVVFY